MNDHATNIQPRRDGDWTASAACREQPPQRFTDPDGPDDVHKALTTCESCVVRPQCLNTALNHAPQADAGIWGGTTEATRHRIRTGALSADEILDTSVLEPHRVVSRATQPDQGRHERPAAHTVPEAEPAMPRLPAPEITLSRDPHGDFVDATGRVIVFRIHGEPPYMLMIDDHCIERTQTVTEARQLAWTVLNNPDLSAHNTTPRVSVRHVR